MVNAVDVKLRGVMLGSEPDEHSDTCCGGARGSDSVRPYRRTGRAEAQAQGKPGGRSHSDGDELAQSGSTPVAGGRVRLCRLENSARPGEIRQASVGYTAAGQRLP